jgi:OOP family OmpA-OmpF porin
VRDNHIEIREKIQFAYNDDKILEVSFSLLDEIAGVIKKNPHVKKIEIGGHASTDGNDAHNLDLSDRRAKSVMKHLVEKGGIEAERLVAKGFGETKPLVTPDESEADREKNRRVEFTIVLQDVTKKRVEIDAATGAEKIVESSTATLDQGK